MVVFTYKMKEIDSSLEPQFVAMETIFAKTALRHHYVCIMQARDGRAACQQGQIIYFSRLLSGTIFPLKAK